MTETSHQSAPADLPIIDFRNASSSDPALRMELAKEIKDACINIGFFYIKNHGIPEEIIAPVFSRVADFFSLTEETKMKLFVDWEKINLFPLTYQPLFSSRIDRAASKSRDMMEGLSLYWDIAKENPAQWPVEAEDFGNALMSYYERGISLANSMYPLLALALDVEEDFFTEKKGNSASLLRVVHYPPQSPTAVDPAVGIGAHTDFRVFTILLQQPEIQALQVRNSKQEWINAPPIPGTLLINLGDQLAYWTNDQFKSTMHRVTNRSGADRYSVPLFFGVNDDVVLEPIPSCVSAENPRKYETITAGEYIKERRRAAYA